MGGATRSRYRGIEAPIKACRRLAIGGGAVGARLNADPALATSR